MVENFKDPFPGIKWLSKEQAPNGDLLDRPRPGIISIRVGSLVIIKDPWKGFRQFTLIGEGLNNSSIRYGSCPGDTDWSILSEDGVSLDPLDIQTINGLVSVTQEVLELKFRKIRSDQQVRVNLTQLYDIFTSIFPHEEYARNIHQMFEGIKLEGLPGQLKRGALFLIDQRIEEIRIGTAGRDGKYRPEDILKPKEILKELAS